MKNACIAILSIIAVAALAWGAVEHSTITKTNASLSDAGERLKSAQGASATLAESSAQFESKLNEASAALSASSKKLASANAQISDLTSRVAALEAPAEKAKSRQELAALQPVIKKGDAIIFPRLLSPSDKLLLENAEFRKTFGRKLIFKKELQLSTFDVDDIHPGALIQLGIDPDKLKSNQAALDKADANFKAAMAAAAQMKLAQDGSFLDKQTAQNAAQAKIDEARRQRQAVEDRQQQALNNDRIRANAAATAATAAVIEAQRPIY